MTNPTPQSNNSSVIVGDRDNLTYKLKVNSDGSINVTSSSGSTTVTPGAVTLTERSGNMTAGGTSQQMMAANTSRKYLLIQNPLTLTGQNIAAAESLFVRFGATAAGVNNGTSWELPPGASMVYEASDIPTAAVQVNAATTSHRWIAVEG